MLRPIIAVLLLLAASVDARMFGAIGRGAVRRGAAGRATRVQSDVPQMMSAHEDEPADFLMLDTLSIPLKDVNRPEKKRPSIGRPSLKWLGDPSHTFDTTDFMLFFHP